MSSFIRKVCRYVHATAGDKTKITGVIVSEQMTTVMTNIMIRLNEGFGQNGPPKELPKGEVITMDSLKDTSTIRALLRDIFMASYDYILRLVMINNGRTSVSPGDVTRIWLLYQVEGSVLAIRNANCCSDASTNKIVDYDGSVSSRSTLSLGYVARNGRSDFAVERSEHFAKLDEAIISGDSKAIADLLPLAFLAERMAGNVTVRKNGFGHVSLSAEQAAYFLSIDSASYVRSVVSTI